MDSSIRIRVVEKIYLTQVCSTRTGLEQDSRIHEAPPVSSPLTPTAMTYCGSLHLNDSVDAVADAQQPFRYLYVGLARNSQTPRLLVPYIP